MGLLGVGHDWVTSLPLFTFMRWRRTWQPPPVFLPGDSQGQGSLVGCVYGVAQSRTRLKWLSSSSSNHLQLKARTQFTCPRKEQVSSAPTVCIKQGGEGAGFKCSLVNGRTLLQWTDVTSGSSWWHHMKGFQQKCSEDQNTTALLVQQTI